MQVFIIKIKSLNFLHAPILAPEVRIVNSDEGVIKEKYIQIGSDIQLRCIIQRIPRTTTNVKWFHVDYVLNTDTQRGGIR